MWRLTSRRRASARSTLAAAARGRGHDVSEAALDELRAEGQVRSGAPLPDLNNYLRLELPPGLDVPTALAQFGALPDVEWVGPIPKPVASAAVPNLVHPGGITGDVAADRYQQYLDPRLRASMRRWAWYGTNGTGAGVRICDLEKNLNRDHSDLGTVKVLNPGPNPANDDNHGTAVLGILAGENNGFGVTGIAHGASLYFAATTSTEGFSLEGDHPLRRQPPGRRHHRYRGADGRPQHQTGRGPGLVVRGAGAGGVVQARVRRHQERHRGRAHRGRSGGQRRGRSGQRRLPDGQRRPLPLQAGERFGRHPGRRGQLALQRRHQPRAQLVHQHGRDHGRPGLGRRHRYHRLRRPPPGRRRPRRQEPLVQGIVRRHFRRDAHRRGAAAVLQSEFRAVNGRSATAAELRTLLRNTGTPQTGSGNIGPLPNLKAAIIQLYDDAGALPTVAPPTLSPTSGTYNMPIQVTIGYGSGQSGSNTNIRYTLNGDEPVDDSFIFIPEQGDTLYLNYGVTLRARAWVRDDGLGRVLESDVASATYTSSTPKVATPVITPGEGSYSQGQQFTLATTTPGATIRYRTDGRAPSFFYPGTDYTGPITLDAGQYEIVARGYKDGYYKSDAAYSGPIDVNAIVLPAPTIYPNGGNFNGETTVYMGSTVLGAEIRYTLDGTEPTATSPRFEEPLLLNPDGNSAVVTVKARVFLAPYTPSEIREATYTIVAVVDPPQIATNQENDEDFATVTMSAPQPNATIRYTTNGAEPTSYSTAYAGPFTLGPGLYTIKAKAYRGVATPSTTTTVELAVANNTEPITDPVLNPFSTRNYVEPFTMTMQTDTPGAVIRYTVTTDGSIAPDPTPPGQAGAQTYAQPLRMDTNGQYRFKAQAFKDNGAGGFNSSNVIGTGTFALSDPWARPRFPPSARRAGFTPTPSM
ncbi:MAG: chitobiase/beta-hexosaminidase C-terminal domain-containing protein [Caldilineaceae bacterium]